MNTQTNGPEEKQAARRRSKEEAFAKFIEEPMTKLAMAMIPPADNPDVFLMLLKATFDAGHNNGASDIVGDLLDAMTKDKKKAVP